MNLRPFLSLLTFLALSVAELSSQEPQWWQTTDGIDQLTDDNDHAAINKGQLLHMVAMAQDHFEELDLEVAASSIALLESYVDGDPSNFVAINIGQLKYAAHPFWATLIKVGQKQESDIPWTVNDLSDDRDHALANIGQLKNAFSFTATGPAFIDTDNDDLPDEWEVLYFGDLRFDVSDDPDGDGLDNEAEYANGTNPYENLNDLDKDGWLDSSEPVGTLSPNNPSVNLQVIIW